MAQKPKPTAEKPPPHTDEIKADEGRRSATDRPRPVDPFEECGPTGGYGGAGTVEGEED